MNNFAKHRPKMCIGLLFLMIASCAAQRPAPEYRHALFDQMGIRTITIMPILDRRSTETDLRLEHHIFGQVTPELTKLGYDFSIVEDSKHVDNLSLYDFLPEYQPLIMSLDLGDAEWLMFIVVEQADSEVKFSGSHGYAHLSGYLYNGQTGEKVWEGTGKGISTDGFIFAALSDGAALKQAAKILALKIPEILGR